MSKQVSKGKKGGRVRGLTKVVKVRVGRQSMEDGRAGNTRRTAMAANVNRVAGKAQQDWHTTRDSG